MLGPVDAEGARLGGTQMRILLGLLLVQRNRIISLDQIINALWEETPPPSALASALSKISRLRTALPSGSLSRDGAGYRLHVNPEHCDADCFGGLMRRSYGERQPAQRLECVEQALALWSGSALADVAHIDFVRPAAVALERSREEAQELRVALLLELGRPHEAIPSCEELLQANPLREGLTGLRARALAAAGRRVEALRSLHDYRQLLAEETGLQPGAVLVELERVLLDNHTDPRTPGPTIASSPTDVAPPAQLAMLATINALRRDDALALLTELRNALAEHDAHPIASLADAERRILVDHQRPLRRDFAAVSNPAQYAAALVERDRSRKLMTEVFEAGPSGGLVGRRGELSWLSGRLDEAQRGTPSAILVVGELGIGKSRLARQVSRMARDRSMTVIVSRCFEHQSDPLEPLRSGLVPALLAAADKRTPSDSKARDANAARMGVLRRLEAGIGPEPNARELSDAIVGEFVQLADSEQVLFVLDDAQWADKTSLDILVDLVHTLSNRAEMAQSSACILITARQAGLRPDVRALEAIRRDPIASTLVLEGLTEREVGVMTQLQGMPGLSRATLAELCRITRGNPLFIEGIAQSRQGRSFASGDLLRAIPAEMHDLIGSMLEALRPVARDFLAVAAISGGPLDVELLAEALELGREDVMLLIEEGRNQGLLEYDERAYQFVHPLFESVCGQHIGPDRRTAVHGRLARALLERRARAGAVSIMHIARHLIEAPTGFDPAAVSLIASEAGDIAFASGEWEFASRCYESAVLSSVGNTVPSARGALLVRQATALTHHGEAVRALHLLDEAIGLLESDSPSVALAMAWNSRLEALMTSTGYRSFDSVGDLERMVIGMEALAPAVAARLHSNLAQLHWAQGRLDDARRSARTAIDVGSKVGAWDAAERGCVEIAMTEWARLELREASDNLALAREFALRSGDRRRLCSPLVRLPMTAFWRGQIADAEQFVTEALEAVRETNYEVETSLLKVAEAQIALAKGAFADALQHLGEAMAIDATSDYPWTTPLLLPTLARTLMLQGDHQGVGNVLARWRARRPEPMQMRAARGIEAILRPTPAAPSHEEWWSDATPDASWVRFGGDGAAGLRIEAAFAGWNPAIANGCASVVATLYERGQVFTTTMALFIPRLHGQAMALLGDPSSRAQLEAALKIAESSHLNTEVALSRLALAELAAHGAEPSAVVAEWAESTRVMARALGMPATVTRCEQLLGARTATSPGQGRDAVASRVENVVVLLIDIVASSEVIERIGDWAFRSISRVLKQELRKALDAARARISSATNLGGGLLGDFSTVQDALRAAHDCREIALSHGLALNSGMHAGDVLREGGTIFGSAVSLAAQMCAVSAPNEILCSQSVRDLAGRSVDFEFRDQGFSEIGGIAEPVRIYSIETTQPPPYDESRE